MRRTAIVSRCSDLSRRSLVRRRMSQLNQARLVVTGFAKLFLKAGGKRAAPIVIRCSDLSSAALCGGGCRSSIKKRSSTTIRLRQGYGGTRRGSRDNSKPAVAGATTRNLSLQVFPVTFDGVWTDARKGVAADASFFAEYDSFLVCFAVI